jgi:hypothetical protein
MKLLSGRNGVVLAAIFTTTLIGCTTYVERTVYRDQPPPEQPAPPPPVVVQTPPPAPPPQVVVVEVRSERDFYEPLTPYGHWEVVGAYGRCWMPARVDSDWRPYCNGHWERTEDGWYWASDEPWAWATYHYGRWDFNPQFGWYWVPQTQWAPAWVSWRRGESYVGWAPLPPSARFERDELIVEERNIPPRGYVFVEERRFMEPVQPKTVIVNNTTIINKTVNITKVKVVNKTVINEGPQTQVIERASGRPVRAVAVRDLRRKTEAEVVAKQKPGRPDNVATTRNPGQAPGVDQKAQSDAQRRQELEKKNQEQLDAQKAARDKQVQMEADRRAKVLEQQKQVEAQKQKQLEAQKTAQDKQAQMEADRRAKELERQKQAEAQRQQRVEAQKSAQEKLAQIEAEQRQQEVKKRAQMEADRRARLLENQKQADAQKAEADTQRRERQQQAQLEQQQHKQEAQRAAEERRQTANEKAEKKPAKKAAKKAEEQSAQPPVEKTP